MPIDKLEVPEGQFIDSNYLLYKINELIEVVNRLEKSSEIKKYPEDRLDSQSNPAKNNYMS